MRTHTGMLSCNYFHYVNGFIFFDDKEILDITCLISIFSFFFKEKNLMHAMCVERRSQHHRP